MFYFLLYELNGVLQFGYPLLIFIKNLCLQELCYINNKIVNEILGSTKMTGIEQYMKGAHSTSFVFMSI